MKQFSNKEKQIIRYIVAHGNSNTFLLANVFNEWFDKKGVTFDLEAGHIKYDYNKVKDVNEILEDEHGIIEIALLIKYLEEKQYIYIIKDKHDVVDVPLALGANSSSVNLAHHLPEDIVNIIKRTLFRVYVAYDLVYIVENNFQTKETQQLALAALQLKESQQQQKLAKQQLEISHNQLLEAKTQTEAAQKQTNAAQKQLIEAKAQTAEAQKQTNEAIKQTIEAIKQTKKVNEQTEKVNEQTNQVNAQTKNSLTQTKLAWGAFIGSALTFVASIVLPLCINKCSHQEEKHVEIINSINGVNTTIQRGSEQINTYIDSINTNEMQQVKQNDSIIQVLNKRENTKNKKK